MRRSRWPAKSFCLHRVAVRPASRSASTVRLTVELLEGRIAPASATFVAPTADKPGLLNIVGTDGKDTLTLTEKVVGQTMKLILKDNGRARAVASLPNSSNAARSLTIEMDGKAGNDVLTNNTRFAAVLDGGVGPDTNVDKVVGGRGNDTFRWNGKGKVTFDGKAGVNRVDTVYQRVGAVVPFDVTAVITNTRITSSVFDANVNDPAFLGLEQFGKATLIGIKGIRVAHLASTFGEGDVMDATRATIPVTLIGGEGPDTLKGGASNDILDGGGDPGGDRPDNLFGNAGNDRLFTGSSIGTFSTNILSGGAGDDTLIVGSSLGENAFLSAAVAAVMNGGGAGDDTILGGAGVDTIDGGDGNDNIDGGGGGDLISFPQFGIGDRIRGGDGDDVIRCAGGDAAGANRVDLSGPLEKIRAQVFGDAGNDTLIGGVGACEFFGGLGNDTLLGGFTEDILHGDDGNDTLDGGGGNDRLFGAAGNDTLAGGDGDDTLDGGLGVNRQDGNAGNDLFTWLRGTGTQTFNGGDGADRVELSYPNLDACVYTDAIVTLNSDVINAAVTRNIDFSRTPLSGSATAAGVERIKFTGTTTSDKVFASFTLPVPVELRGAGGDDQLQGGGVDDFLDGGDGNDLLVGQGGNDRILGGLGDDSLSGTDGDDSLEGGPGNDIVSGDNGKDFVDGGTGDDLCLGGEDSDTLVGGDGADRLRGDNGDDSLNGSAGNDDLDTGLGRDTAFDRLGANTVVSPDADSAFPVTEGALTNEQLNQEGGLTAVLLGGTDLFIVGASTGGMQFTGQWSTSTDASGNEVFTATSNLITLQTGLGFGLPIPVVAGTVRVITAPDATPGGGPFVTFAAGTNNLAAPLGFSTNPLGGTLGRFFADTFGLILNSPGTVFGIASGSQLSDENNPQMNLDLPLAPGLPYFFFKGTFGGSVAFGGGSISTGLDFAIAFNPADPSLMVRFPSPTPELDEFAFGASLHGYIPFVPEQLPSHLRALGFEEDEPVGYGNLFGRASGQFAETPISVEGEIVIGLNTSRNGGPLGINGNKARQFLEGTGNVANRITGLFNAQTLDEIFLGLNGNVSVGFSKLDDLVDFSLDVGSGSVVLANRGLSLRAEPTDPFKGTFLENVIKPRQKGFADGFIDKDLNYNLDIDFTQSEDQLSFGSVLNANGRFHLDNQGLRANLDVGQTFGFLGKTSLQVSALIDFNTGSFDFAANFNKAFEARVDIGAISLEVLTLSSSLSAHLKFESGNLSLFVGASFSGSVLGVVRGSATGTIFVSAGNSGFDIRGTARASLKVLFFPEASVDIGFSTTGFSIDTSLGSIAVDW